MEAHRTFATGSLADGALIADNLSARAARSHEASNHGSPSVPSGSAWRTHCSARPKGVRRLARLTTQTLLPDRCVPAQHAG
jgi:hypothetical protein